MAIDVTTPEFDDLLVHAFNLHRAGRSIGVNPFDNNFVREVLICRQAGLLWNPGRGETDAFDAQGRQYELKSTDIARGPIPMWPTSREVSASVLAAFRSMDSFLFALFDGIDLLALYRRPMQDLEPFFAELDEKLAIRTQAGKNLNNPKIPWRVVRPGADVLLLDPRFEEPAA